MVARKPTLRDQAEFNVLKVRGSWDAPGFEACVESELERLKGTPVRKQDRATFKRLATKRVNKAIRHIRLIGNLSNKQNYAYDPKDVKRIFAALAEEMKEAQQRFEMTKPEPFELKP